MKSSTIQCDHICSNFSIVLPFFLNTFFRSPYLRSSCWVLTKPVAKSPHNTCSFSFQKFASSPFFPSSTSIFFTLMSLKIFSKSSFFSFLSKKNLLCLIFIFFHRHLFHIDYEFFPRYYFFNNNNSPYNCTLNRIVKNSVKHITILRMYVLS